MEPDVLFPECQHGIIPVSGGKRIVFKKMANLNDLFEQNPYVQKKKEIAYASDEAIVRWLFSTIAA